MKNYRAVEQFVLNELKEKLPPNLYYHGMHHTLEVLKMAEMIGTEEGITNDEMVLLKTAVIYHDSGFIKVYKNHEAAGCEMARHDLPGFGYTADEIEKICGMIMATKIPQNPQNKLENIIADADLEYLGTDKFEIVGRTLYEEIKIYLDVESERQWNIIQVNFLKSHRYHTEFCKKNREEKKIENLNAILKIVQNYDPSSVSD